jgi:virulence-associated protein VapD
MTVEIVLFVLWVISIGLTEYAKTAALSENAHAAIQAYTKVVLMLRSIRVKPNSQKTVYLNSNGKFVKMADVTTALNTGHRIVQGALTGVLGTTGGAFYFI